MHCSCFKYTALLLFVFTIQLRTNIVELQFYFSCVKIHFWQSNKMMTQEM